MGAENAKIETAEKSAETGGHRSFHLLHLLHLHLLYHHHSILHRPHPPFQVRHLNIYERGTEPRLTTLLHAHFQCLLQKHMLG